MAEVMVTAMPFSGHVRPLLQASAALVRAGHRVRVYTGAAFADAVRAAGATPVPWRAAPDFAEQDLAAVIPQAGRRGPRGALANLEHVFVRTGRGQVEDLLQEWDSRPWDVLVADSLSMGGALVSERLGTPWATLSVVPLAMRSRDLPPPGLPLTPGRGRLGRTRDAALRGAARLATRRLRAALRQTRASVGLDAGAVDLDQQWFSPYLVLALGVPGLEPVRSDLPEHVHFIGSFPPEGAQGALPPGWEDAVRASRPVVHVTQGTLGTDPDDLLRPALAALASREVTVLATTGIPGRATLPFAAPENTQLAGQVPYGALLPEVDVVVTNGGWGGVLAALRHGIPLVVAGGDLDKPAIAAMVARSGAGVDLRTGHPAARSVGKAVDRVLSDSTYRDHAQRLADQFAQYDAGAEVVHLVRRLAEQQGPVLRRSDPWVAQVQGCSDGDERSVSSGPW